MASVENIVRELILVAPDSCSNRGEALEQVLCTVGSGYQWTTDGEIVAIHELGEPWSPDRDVIAFMDELFTLLDDETKATVEKALRVDDEQAIETLKNIDSRVDEWKPLRNLYPQYKHALISRIPDNVTNEWREACDKMIELIAEHRKTAEWAKSVEIMQVPESQF